VSAEIERLGERGDTHASAPETRALINASVAMLVGTFIVVPVILAQTIGTGNLLLFVFIIAPIGLIAGDYLMTWLHSLNTAVAGWITGARLRYVIVGPLVICGRGMSPRLRWEPRRTTYSGTYVGTYQQDLTGQETVQRERYAFMLTLIGVVALILLLAVLISNGSTHWLLRIMAVAVTSSTIKTVVSAKHILSAQRSPDRSYPERQVAADRLALDSALGIRPGDLDPSLLDQLTATADSSSYEVYGWLVQAERAMDRGDFADAERSLMRALVIVNIAQMTLMTSACLMAAFLAAYRDGDAATARVWQKLARSEAPELHTQARIEAAILMAEGNTQGAIETARQGLAALERSLDPGIAKLDETILQDILRRLSVDTIQHATLEATP
jgi:hypothetical protein